MKCENEQTDEQSKLISFTVQGIKSVLHRAMEHDSKTARSQGYKTFFMLSYVARMNLQFLVIWDLLAGQISCSTELSMKEVL